MLESQQTFKKTFDGAASAGYDIALTKIREGFMIGWVTKVEFERVLRE